MTPGDVYRAPGADVAVHEVVGGADAASLPRDAGLVTLAIVDDLQGNVRRNVARPGRWPRSAACPHQWRGGGR